MPYHCRFYVVVDVDKNPLKGPVYVNKENRWKIYLKEIISAKRRISLDECIEIGMPFLWTMH